MPSETDRWSQGPLRKTELLPVVAEFHDREFGVKRSPIAKRYRGRFHGREESMPKSWAPEKIEHAVMELVANFHMSGPQFRLLTSCEQIQALTAAASALALHSQQVNKTSAERTQALITAEEFISQARKALVAIRFNLLPREASDLLTFIQLATDKLDALDDREVRTSFQLEQLPLKRN